VDLWRVLILESEIAVGCSHAFAYDLGILQWRLDTLVVKVINRDILFGAAERHDEVWRRETAQ
jgi:hypothetical protein